VLGRSHWDRDIDMLEQDLSNNDLAAEKRVVIAANSEIFGL
jgi:hypothetical protein